MFTGGRVGELLRVLDHPSQGQDRTGEVPGRTEYFCLFLQFNLTETEILFENLRKIICITVQTLGSSENMGC